MCRAGGPPGQVWEALDRVWFPHQYGLGKGKTASFFFFLLP